MLSLTLSSLAFSWGGLAWNLGAVVLFILALVLVLIILVQDSQSGGVGGAFGGGGGDSLLGARAQRGITKFTAGLGIVFCVLLVFLGKFNPDSDKKYAGDENTVLPGSLESPEIGAKDGTDTDTGAAGLGDELENIIGGLGEETTDESEATETETPTPGTPKSGTPDSGAADTVTPEKEKKAALTPPEPARTAPSTSGSKTPTETSKETADPAGGAGS